MVLVPWKYYRNLTSFEQQMNKLFDRFFQGELGTFGKLIPSFPQTTIQETRNRYLVTIDAKSFSPKDLTVSVDDNTLIIEGRRQSTEHEPEGRRAARSFKRTLRFPHHLSERITARYRNGKLIIHIPKQRPRGPRTIMISS